MASEDVRDRLIRIAYNNEELRDCLMPAIEKAQQLRQAPSQEQGADSRQGASHLPTGEDEKTPRPQQPQRTTPDETKTSSSGLSQDVRDEDIKLGSLVDYAKGHEGVADSISQDARKVLDTLIRRRPSQ